MDSQPDRRGYLRLSRHYEAASQDKPLRSILPGVAGKHRAWVQASAAIGNHIQAGHIPPVGETARLRSAGRSAILHRAPRQTGRYRHNDWQASGDSPRHSPYCRNRAARFLMEWFRLHRRGRFLQIRRLMATEQEKASRWKFFRSGKKRDKPQHPNRSSRNSQSKEKPVQFCTVYPKLCTGNRMKCCHFPRFAIYMLDFCNDRAQPPSDACPIPATKSR